MTMNVHGTIDPAELARLSALTANQTTTESVFAFIDARDLMYEFIAMDEYTIDLVVRLPSGLTLVYDTT